MLALGATTAGCIKKSAAFDFCTGADGTLQDCTICCDVDKAKECCDEAEKLKAGSEKKE